MFEKTKALCDSFLKMGVPGFDLMVCQNGKCVLRYMNGYSDREKKIPMKGDTILYIPLGSNHGVEVTGDRHMHYMWIDFMPDNELGLARLEASHKPTGKWNSFSADGKKS